MKLTEDQLGRLLGLKRHEKPPEGYLEDSLREFHLRRRREALQGGARTGLWRRFAGWLAGAGWTKWAYGAGVAYATVMVAWISLPRGHELDRQAPLPASHPTPAFEKAPAPLEVSDGMDLHPPAEARPGEREF